jgi:hypothetical protein
MNTKTQTVTGERIPARELEYRKANPQWQYYDVYSPGIRKAWFEANAPVRRKIVFDHEIDPDLSWLDQPEFKNEDPSKHIALEMTVYEMSESDDDWELVDSLGGIDCLADAGDWATGTFYRVSQLPEGYLRQLAIEAGLQG